MDKKSIIVLWLVVIIVVAIFTYKIFKSIDEMEANSGETTASNLSYFTICLRIAMNLLLLGSAIICTVRSRW